MNFSSDTNRRFARLIKLNKELTIAEMVPTPQYFCKINNFCNIQNFYVITIKVIIIITVVVVN
jgi:hypothetical protein